MPAGGPLWGGGPSGDSQGFFGGSAVGRSRRFFFCRDGRLTKGGAVLRSDLGEMGAWGWLVGVGGRSSCDWR